MRDPNDVMLERTISRIIGETDGRLSLMASKLQGSEILKIASDVRAMLADGQEICDLTVGDFSPAQFRIPKLLEHSLKDALTRGETYYPPTDGLAQLKRRVQQSYADWLGLEYPLDSIVITSGSRPGIFATYSTLVDPGDVVVYPVPSWNNNHYSHLVRAVGRPIICGEESAFLPTRSLLEHDVRDARLIALNSPLNPTGTAFDQRTLEEICDLVLEENNRRKHTGKRPLYVMYDQVYWMLTFGSTIHVHPVGVRPEMSEYTIYVDGISKAFAATGVRVGWAAGPRDIIQRMASMLAHVGAWAPRAEQVATAEFLADPNAVAEYSSSMKGSVRDRLEALFSGITDLRAGGFPVKSITPMGAIYLSVQFNIVGKRTPEGEQLRTNEDIRQYLLRKAHVALVPFQAFGFQEENGWFRLSVGAVSVNEIQNMFEGLKEALSSLR